MKDKEFDHIIRDKLGDLSAPQDPFGWEELSARMDAGIPTANQEFDQVLFEKLNTLEGTSKSAPWESFVLHMELIQLPARLLQLKVLELLVLLFLLLPFTTKDPSFKSNAIAESAQTIADPLQSESIIIPSSEGNSIAYPLDSKEEKESASLDITPKSPVAFVAQPISTTEPLPLRRPNQIGLTQTPQLALALSDVPWTNSSNSAGGSLGPGANMDQWTAIQQLPTTVAPLPASTTPEVARRPAKRLRNPLILSIYSGFNYHKVVTPAQNYGEVPPVIRYHPGFEAGAALAFGLGKLELETKLKYTSYKYLPQQVVYLQGSVLDGLSSAGLRKVELNAVSLGFNARYNLWSKGRWVVSMGAGLMLNTIINAGYDLGTLDEFLPGNPVPESRINPYSPPPTESVGNKVYKEGWLEGGAFSENSFLSADLNVGGEFLLNPKLSLFGRASFQPFLPFRRQGLGPDKDRIHSLGLQAGLRIRFKR